MINHQKQQIIIKNTMSELMTLKRGLDLKLEGGVPSGSQPRRVDAGLFAVCPDDFPGVLPKVEVKEGDAVLCGSPLLRDKETEDVKLVSPVAGTVEKIVRGERRKIMRVEVRAAAAGADASVDYKGAASTAQEAERLLQNSGLWAMMRQRPYDIVPKAGVRPRDIFVTAFDSAPLAQSLTALVKGRDAELDAGVKLLRMLTDGNVYVGVSAADTVFRTPAGAEEVRFAGPHPAGNAGVQAANIAPVNKGETVWTLDIVTLARIGAVVLNGKADWTATVAVTGSEIAEPHLVATRVGACISEIAGAAIKDDERNKRVISGNVLCGTAVGVDGFLRYPYEQVTVIPEGDDVDEFMGWASLSPKKMSVSASFPSRFMPWKRFAPDARLQGGRRAMIMSGLYEKMLPMDIMAEYLIKAIIARDIDRMETLGIYEVAPEDFALCEYIDPSKLELQKIVREGLDYMRKEVE